MTLEYETLKEESKKHGIILDGHQPGVRTLVGALAVLGYNIISSSQGGANNAPFVDLSLTVLQEKELRNRLCEYNGHPECLPWLLNESSNRYVLSPSIDARLDSTKLHKEASKLGEFLYLRA